MKSSDRKISFFKKREEALKKNLKKRKRNKLQSPKEKNDSSFR